MTAMTAPRRRGTETSATRAVLLDTTERLMLAEGYAAVGIRRVAREAGVAPALVLYYFQALDDLFLATLRLRAEQELARLAEALGSPRPLRAIWETGRRPGMALIMEFAALANHRTSIRSELAAYAARFRALQLQAVPSATQDDGIEPVAVLVVLTGISQIISMERALGFTDGHAETLALVERQLDRLEPPSEDDGE
jgi:AcrR family transcriptional regulator